MIQAVLEVLSEARSSTQDDRDGRALLELAGGTSLETEQGSEESEECERKAYLASLLEGLEEELLERCFEEDAR